MKTLKEFLWTLVHFGPIATLVLVKTITLSVIYCSLMWWPPHENVGGLICLTSFLVASGLVMYNFFCSIFLGPGYLPLGWKPSDETDASKLQVCYICQGYKAPRAHHCRKCGRCVMKLDHHCPWINSCVGHINHAHFVAFLVCAVWGCGQASIILACSLYRAVYRSYYIYHDIEDVPIVFLGLYGFMWCLFSLGCAIGVTLGVGVLLYYQMKVVLRNQTTIEEWIVEKANYRRKKYSDLNQFIYPYDMGWKQNFFLVMNIACKPIGDGIHWVVRPECDQFTLTIEQMEQKNEKKKRMKEYTVVDEFSGSWCPVSKGVGVFFHPPFSDESRILLNKDDRLLVTRWKKYWLYGEKVNPMENSGQSEIVSGPRVKGWFPRRCVLEVMNSSRCQQSDSDADSDTSKPVDSKASKKKN